MTATVNQYQQWNAKLNGDVANLNGVIAERDHRIKELNHTVKDYKELVDNLAAEGLVQRQMVADREAEIQRQNACIAAHLATIEAQKAANLELQNHLTNC